MNSSSFRSSRIAVIWIDWYPYHVARFRGIQAACAGSVTGIELVGGVGVHTGLKFREELPPELPVHTLMPQTSWWEAGKFALARALWRKLSQLDPEVLLIPDYYTLPGIAAALWARLHGACGVLMTESTAFDHARTNWKEAIKSLLLRTLFPWAIAGGTAHVDYLCQLGFAASHIQPFYDVVDNDFFHQGTSAERAHPNPGNAPYFVYVGRLAEGKNVAGLLHSWFDYRTKSGSWGLVLVGDGPEAAALRAIAAASPHAEDVHFPGLKSSHDLVPFYAHAGCFVLPSAREPWGEAMASALPVLVSNHCGCANDLVVPGLNGFLFDPADRAGLCAALTRIAALSYADRERMGPGLGQDPFGRVPALCLPRPTLRGSGCRRHRPRHPARRLLRLGGLQQGLRHFRRRQACSVHRPPRGHPCSAIARHQCGWQIDPGDTAAVTGLLLELADNPRMVREAGERARHSLLLHYDLPLAIDRFAHFFRASASMAAEADPAELTAPQLQ